MLSALTKIILSLLMWGLAAPIAVFIPRRHNRLVVIGRHNGLFIDNCKHFFLFLNTLGSNKPDVAYITTSHKEHRLLTSHGLPALMYPGIRGIYYLLTSGTVITDNAEWIHGGKLQLSAGAFLVQLWHGIPLKAIELRMLKEQLNRSHHLLRPLLHLYKTILGRHYCADLVISTSEYVTATSIKQSIPAKAYLNSGYPRNDVLNGYEFSTDPKDPRLINTDEVAIHKILNYKQESVRIALYAPTFRKDHSNPFENGALDLDRMDAFSRENNLVLVLKLHPVIQFDDAKDRYRNILVYRTDADIYPAMSLFDILITDYSSIFFDFLLTGSPVIFYAYDLEAYRADDRPLMYDYDEITPGPTCTNQNELEAALIESEKETHMEQRDLVVSRFFDHTDDLASRRIWEYLKTHSSNVS